MYVVDSELPNGPPHAAGITVFDVNGTALANPRAFADFTPGRTDGIRCDTDGKSGAPGDGRTGHQRRARAPSRWALLAVLHTPEVVANLCFGGRKRNRLFICASTSLYGIYVNATGHALG